MKKSMMLFAAICLQAVVGGALADADTPAPGDAYAYIISPADGAEVTSPVTVRFGLSGMGVAPAGTQVEATGHHHLIIDAPLPDFNQPIPADENHIHFGKGQTQAVIKLSTGKHELQLVLGDYKHVAHERPITSPRITITVK